jgi:hypothetical protein
VYLIVNEARTAAKVGVAKDIAKRMATLKTGNPDMLELLAFAKGGRTEESEIHGRLKALDLHLSGEWFEQPSTCLRALCGYGPTVEIGGLAPKGMRPNFPNLNRAVSIDPDVLGVLAMALDVEQSTECSCVQFYRRIKREIMEIVGWTSHAEDPWMRGSDAYRSVFLATWACLPPCRRDVCVGSEW